MKPMSKLSKKLLAGKPPWEVALRERRRHEAEIQKARDWDLRAASFQTDSGGW